MLKPPSGGLGGFSRQQYFTNSMNKKCILITDSANLARHLKSAIRQHDMEIEKDPLLSDLKVIKENINRVGNTSEIRVAFGKYIKANGMPPLFILDYTLNLGLSQMKDPDHRKLLRTIMISYAILLQGKGYNQRKNPIILTCDEKFEKHMQVFQKEPHHLFKIMTTENPKINEIIKMFSNNPQLARDYFMIDFLVKPTAGVIQGQVHKIFDLVAVVKRNQRKQEASNNVEIKETEPKTAEPRSVNLQYRFKNNKFFDNGQISSYNEDVHGVIATACLIINGDWLSVNQMEVSEKILSAFTKSIFPEIEKEMGPGQNKKIEHDINICLTDKCRVDPGIVPSLITLIEKELKKYGKVNINISPENKKIISQTAGFKLLDNYILQDL